MLPSLDPLAVWIAAALTATLFGHAALAKLADLPLFEQHLAAYGVPQTLLGPATRLLPALELLAAVLLMLLTPWRAAGAALAAGLLLAYAAVMAWQRLQRRSLDCGCGGAPLPISWLLVARNLALLLLALPAAMPMSARAMDLSDFAVVAASVLLAVPLYAAFNQVLRHTAAHRTHQTPAGSTSWTR
ncbi:MauE/DoxX family redox-associated membrane protein [Paucibacter soli]|uniref:MauE/DoxX family redox-associated membrane protein n=1 Tax=Paucibacter soli TaxID=3133433 RepID=UPI00309AE93F